MGVYCGWGGWRIFDNELGDGDGGVDDWEYY